MKFLEEQGIAQFTGKWMPSGFMSFPVFRFNEDKLREIDPKMFAEYAMAHGKEVSAKEPLAQQIQSATQRTVTPDRPSSKDTLDR